MSEPQRVAWKTAEFPAAQELFEEFEIKNPEEASEFRQNIKKIQFREWTVYGHKCHGMVNAETKAQQGIGRRILNDGRIQEGFFKNGLVLGWAKEVYVSGDAFVGCIQNSAKNGKGTYYFQDGSYLQSIDGQWINGIKKGSFKMVYPDGKEEILEYKL